MILKSASESVKNNRSGLGMSEIALFNESLFCEEGKPLPKTLELPSGLIDVSYIKPIYVSITGFQFVFQFYNIISVNF